MQMMNVASECRLPLPLAIHVQPIKKSLVPLVSQTISVYQLL